MSDLRAFVEALAVLPLCTATSPWRRVASSFMAGASVGITIVDEVPSNPAANATACA
jgi:hypothetical protein